VRGVVPLLLLLASAPRLAVAVTVTATIDPPKLAVGESADLSVKVEGTQSAPTPQIANTAGLGVSYVGPASQVSFVNGRVTASVTHHFTVIGTKPGRFALGPITVEAEGKRYDAGTVSVELLPARAAAAPDGNAAGDQVTLELSLARTTAYVGERIPLGVKLLGAARVTDRQLPQVPGDGFALDKMPTDPSRGRSERRAASCVIQTTLTRSSRPAHRGPGTAAWGSSCRDCRTRFFGGFSRRAARSRSVGVDHARRPACRTSRRPPARWTVHVRGDGVAA
jgi:hypothetical protein